MARVAPPANVTPEIDSGNNHCRFRRQALCSRRSRLETDQYLPIVRLVTSALYLIVLIVTWKRLVSWGGSKTSCMLRGGDHIQAASMETQENGRKMSQRLDEARDFDQLHAQEKFHLTPYRRTEVGLQNHALGCRLIGHSKSYREPTPQKIHLRSYITYDDPTTVTVTAGEAKMFIDIASDYRPSTP